MKTKLKKKNKEKYVRILFRKQSINLSTRNAIKIVSQLIIIRILSLFALSLSLFLSVNLLFLFPLAGEAVGLGYCNKKID